MTKFFNTHNNIILLENLRFFPEEEKNDDSFAKKISSLADIYVNECFSTCHRKHSSITGIPKVFTLLPWNITRRRNFKPKKLIQVTDQNSSTAVFGGSKVSTKIKIIDFYIKEFNKILIGGAMANTFLASKNINIGSSLYEKTMLKVAVNFLNDFGKKYYFLMMFLSKIN